VELDVSTLQFVKRSSTDHLDSPLSLSSVYLIKGIKSDITQWFGCWIYAVPFCCARVRGRIVYLSIPRDFLLAQISHRDRRLRLLPEATPAGK